MQPDDLEISLTAQRQHVKEDRQEVEHAAQQVVTAAYLATVQRIEPALPELERLLSLHPESTSTAGLLAAAGMTFADLGMMEEDGLLLDQMMAEYCAASGCDCQA
ncbi:MAG: hypothetical protein HOV92_12705 [Streptomyces sp.]|nr:hypothetical protein [Streptomyces sp.]